MSIIWYESLYHYGFKSRQYECPVIQNNLAQEDKRLLAYLWKHDPKYTKSRKKGTTDGIAREYSEKVYRENITDHTCFKLYD